MFTKKAKTMLFVSLIAAVAIPLSLQPSDAEQNTNAEHLRKLFAGVDEEIRQYVNGDMKSPEEKKAQLIEKYSGSLEAMINFVAIQGNWEFGPEDVEGLKKLIVTEHMSEMNRQKMISKIPDDAIRETLEVRITGCETPDPASGDCDAVWEMIEASPALSKQSVFDLPKAHASGNPYPVDSWKQVTHDRSGGSGTDSAGNHYSIGGQNNGSLTGAVSDFGRLWF